MPRRKGFVSPYCCFVSEQLPELQRRRLPVTCVSDAIPYCSQAWAMLTKEEKMAYAEKARKLSGKKCSQKTVKETCNLALPVPASPTAKTPCVTFPDASDMSWKNDQAVLVDIFYFLNIYSHGKLPSHCEQRFLPCEIGCVKYCLQDGIISDFHHFIEPEVPPRGFRYHCQAASDATHKIPISGFHLPRTCYAVVLWELLEFVQPARGVWPRFYCRSNDRFRISWCLNRMASMAGGKLIIFGLPLPSFSPKKDYILMDSCVRRKSWGLKGFIEAGTGIESHLELLDVEDLVIELYQKKYQKEPSKTWVCRELDAFLWDFSSNTRCKWHEENDILCCALASCKKIVYCISKSLASAYGVSLTAAHLPLQDLDNGESTNTKMVILDAGRFQNMKAGGPACDRHFASPSRHQEFVPSNCDSPCGVKTCSFYETSTMRGRGITRLLKSASDLTKPFSN